MFDLKKVRYHLGKMTPTDMAKKAGITRATLYRMEEAAEAQDHARILKFSYAQVTGIAEVLMNGHREWKMDFVEEFYSEYDATDMVVRWVHKLHRED